MGKPKTDELVDVCNSCGKARSTRRGSLTEWMFRKDDVCRCLLPRDTKPPKSQSAKQSAISPPSHAQFSNQSEKTASAGKPWLQTDPDVVELVVAQETQPPGELAEVDELIGKTIGQYEIESRIGAGGMSVVYKAQHLHIDKTVAIKVLSPDRKPSKDAMMRFRQEAQAACALNHENIVGTREFNVDENGQTYLVMDFVKGESLKDTLAKRQRLPVYQTVKIAIDVACGLSHAHRHGVVHRDIKPDNIMICLMPDQSSICKVVDFGIAKTLFGTGTGDAKNLTQTGELFGSPMYMSPEQCLGRKIDARSDIYSLGCVMYEAMSGAPPFAAESIMETMMQHINAAPPLLVAETAEAQRLAAVIMRALEKDPAARYQSMDELIADLQLIQAGKDPSASIVSPLKRLNLTSIRATNLKRNLRLIAVVFILGVIASTAIYLTLTKSELQKLQPGKVATLDAHPVDIFFNKSPSDYGVHELVQVFLRPKNDCYCYVFNVNHEDQASMLYPTSYGGSPFLKAGATTKIDRMGDYGMAVDEHLGHITAICLKSDRPFLKEQYFDLQNPANPMMLITGRQLDSLIETEARSNGGVIERVDTPRLGAPRVESVEIQTHSVEPGAAATP